MMCGEYGSSARKLFSLDSKNADRKAEPKQLKCASVPSMCSKVSLNLEAISCCH